MGRKNNPICQQIWTLGLKDAQSSKVSALRADAL